MSLFTGILISGVCSFLVNLIAYYYKVPYTLRLIISLVFGCYIATLVK